MSHVMNKNVIHNGHSMSKGKGMKKGDKYFEEMVEAGHAEALAAQVNKEDDKKGKGKAKDE